MGGGFRNWELDAGRWAFAPQAFSKANPLVIAPPRVTTFVSVRVQSASMKL